MASVVPLRCTCGKVRGAARDVAPETGSRLTCMCQDCQTYAHWLGRADEVLDEHGGTEVFQMTPAQLEITDGAEYLRCIRQSKKGAHRWYASCCNTPVGNTVGPRFAFVGVPHLFWDPESDGRSRDEILGPVLAKNNARWARGTPPPDAHPRAPFGTILRSAWLLGKGWLRGAHQPSPFWDGDGKPLVELEQMTLEERERLRAIVRGQT